MQMGESICNYKKWGEIVIKTDILIFHILSGKMNINNLFKCQCTRNFLLIIFLETEYFPF